MSLLRLPLLLRLPRALALVAHALPISMLRRASPAATAGLSPCRTKIFLEPLLALLLLSRRLRRRAHLLRALDVHLGGTCSELRCKKRRDG